MPGDPVASCFVSARIVGDRSFPMNPISPSITAALALASGLMFLNSTRCLGEEKDKWEGLRNELRQRFSSALDMRFDQPYANTGHPNQKVDVYLPKKPKSDKPL